MAHGALKVGCGKTPKAKNQKDLLQYSADMLLTNSDLWSYPGSRTPSGRLVPRFLAIATDIY
jgi:hypothetical protein